MTLFDCHLCGHQHSTADQLLALPNICGWCGDQTGMYSVDDPGDHVLTF